MKKRTAGLLACLCALLLAAAFSSASAAPSTFTSGYYNCTLQNDGTAMITGYTGEEAVLVLPAELEGVPVTAIGPSAFQANLELIDLVIPEGVVSLGDYAFQRCPNLTGVSLPATMEEVGLNPFAGCEALLDVDVAGDHPYLEVRDSVLFSKEDHRLIYYPRLLEKGPYDIPFGTRIIGASAFYQCDNLTDITIPDTVTAIGRRAFYQCSSLRAINLPPEISTVGADAFCGCASLNSITFPEKVASIGERAFQDCSNLEHVVLP